MGALAKLGINAADLLAQVINFGILLVVLYLLAYRPILKMLDERARRIKDSIEQTEMIKDQAARADEESRHRVEAGIKEGQELINRAAKAADGVRQEGQRKAQEDAQALVARARSEIQRERDEAVGALRQEFADLTIMAAEKVIDRSLDKEAHRDVIDKVLEEARTLKQG